LGQQEIEGSGMGPAIFAGCCLTPDMTGQDAMIGGRELLHPCTQIFLWVQDCQIDVDQGDFGARILP
jgi:hypothetical protein